MSLPQSSNLFPCSSSVASGRQRVNGVDLHYEQTGRGKHAVLLLPGALGKHKYTPLLNVVEDLSHSHSISVPCHVSSKLAKSILVSSTTGSTRTDFGPQLRSLNKDRFTLVAWDPRGYGQSRPPDRDFPPDFFERDAKDAVDLMKVQFVCRSARIIIITNLNDIVYSGGHVLF